LIQMYTPNLGTSESTGNSSTLLILVHLNQQAILGVNLKSSTPLFLVHLN
jgi:hypothetical protein